VFSDEFSHCGPPTTITTTTTTTTIITNKSAWHNAMSYQPFTKKPVTEGKRVPFRAKRPTTTTNQVGEALKNDPFTTKAGQRLSAKKPLPLKPKVLAGRYSL